MFAGRGFRAQTFHHQRGTSTKELPNYFDPICIMQYYRFVQPFRGFRAKKQREKKDYYKVEVLQLLLLQ